LPYTNAKPIGVGFNTKAMEDKYWGLRFFILQQVARQWSRKTDTTKCIFEPILYDLAKNEKNALVRGQAIDMLGTYVNHAYKHLFIDAVNDSSYTIAGAALTALSKIDSAAASQCARKQMSSKLKRSLAVAVLTAIMNDGKEDDFNFMVKAYNQMPFTSYKLNVTLSFANYIDKIHDTAKIKQCIDFIINFRNPGPDVFKRIINDELKKLAIKKEAEGLKEQANYINSFLPK